LDFLNAAPEDEIWLQDEHWQEMLADVMARAPEEACGLVAGLSGKSQRVFRLTNVLHSKTGYQMDPKEQLEAFQEIDKRGWNLLAIYHSHPAGPPGPSPTDVERATYPMVIYLVWSGDAGGWRLQGYSIRSGEVKEVQVYREYSSPHANPVYKRRNKSENE
jgi:proteasome lid subunit RPN8/RPN11